MTILYQYHIIFQYKLTHPVTSKTPQIKPDEKKSKKPPIYVITPTYPRPVQLAELTRLAYVLQVFKVLQLTGL